MVSRKIVSGQEVVWIFVWTDGRGGPEGRKEGGGWKVPLTCKSSRGDFTNDYNSLLITQE